MAPIQHTNRKGQTYYLHKSTTKTGKPRYYFSMKGEGDLVESIPDGFEIYENPNAQVYLRRTRPKIITDDEIAVVEKGMKRYCQLENYLIDVKKNIIAVYEPDQDVDRLSQILSFASMRKAGVKDMLTEFLTYSPMLQFVLIDKEKRIFVTQRYCSLGSIDDWIEIGELDTLKNLVKTYVKHLGQETYFELL